MLMNNLYKASGGSFMTKSILVVDDQVGIRMLLEDVLSDSGYQISLASNGKEAIEKLTAFTYDLVILDYQLPVFNGKVVIEKMHDEGIAAQVIVISGLPELVRKELGEGILAKVISKPFNLTQLCKIVDDILTKNE